MSNKTAILTADFLTDEYIHKNRTISEIAENTGLNRKTVGKRIAEYGLRKSSKEIYDSSSYNALSDKSRRAAIEESKRMKRLLENIGQPNCPCDPASLNLPKDTLIIPGKAVVIPKSDFNRFFTFSELVNIRTREKIYANIRNAENGNIIRISARKCTVREIGSVEKNRFLDLYDFAGPDVSMVKLGLFYYDELVSVMTFSRFSPDGKWKLSRFCVKEDYTVYGGPSKLFGYFAERHLKCGDTVRAHSDHSKFSGKMFPILGFRHVRTRLSRCVTDPAICRITDIFEFTKPK